MKRERINRALRNEAQFVVAERNLATAEAKVRYWSQRLSKLLTERLALRLESQLPLGRYTQKSKKKYVVWHTVKDILSRPEHRRGLTTTELFYVTRQDHGPLNLITFRAYLREFSSLDRGLLKKQSDRWHLTDGVASMNPSSEALGADSAI